MITEKVTDNQRITVSEMPMTNYRTMGDSVYSAEKAACSASYREYLEGLLNNQGVAVPEDEYEDARRYQSNEGKVEARTTDAAVVDAVMPQAPQTSQKEETETVRVFNQKRAVWLIIYILLAMGVVLALLFTMPGTAWERKSITVDNGVDSYPVAQADEATLIANGINTIETVNGEVITVSLTPYEEVKPQTNWFDNLCDWLNNVIGG
jgi:hypothetical protein